MGIWGVFMLRPPGKTYLGFVSLGMLWTIRSQFDLYVIWNIAYETFNSMKPRDMYGNKWSLFITKMIIDHVVKEQYPLMLIFHQRNITFELPAETDQHCTCTHVTGCICDLHLLMCPKLTQYQTHKHYIAGSLKPRSPSARWARGVSMGGPTALWTRDYSESRKVFMMSVHTMKQDE